VVLAVSSSPQYDAWSQQVTHGARYCDTNDMAQKGAHRTHEQWLLELTDLPTAAGRETRVLAWITAWAARRRNLALTRDRAGNVFITQRRQSQHAGRPPLFITAHLDHPGFVVAGVRGAEIELEFRGSVHDPYFESAAIEIVSSLDARAGRHTTPARIVTLNAKAKPFKRVVARSDGDATGIQAGDIARFAFDGDTQVPRIEDGILHSYACDDLAAVAAALAAMDLLRMRPGMSHVGLLFTRAEEVGFVGALAACKARSIPKRARLICLENSRSFAESPIGEGPIVRVGDRMSVFEPSLTNDISLIMTEHQKRHPRFRWQRKLMPGGTCEATAFSIYGYRSTCLCLPLGNYHNMIDIDQVQAGQRPARVAPEFISMADFHGLVEMLVLCAEGLESTTRPTLYARMETLLREHGHVLEE
jgi:putative aminopeptidase FrvX